MRIHILGIGGSFMGSVAMIAKRLGHQVSGMDEKIYPPMSTALEAENIPVIENYRARDLPAADCFIIGNVIVRGNPCAERILNENLPHTSGAAWLADYVLCDRSVLAVAGTHGKTTTASMLAWILEKTGHRPGFLIGGKPHNFNHSARLGASEFFVIEADEYDTAFFDKRAKFIHYRPRTLIINRLEFDHADIFDSLADIQTQFHHLIRTVPGDGQIICPQNQENIEAVIRQGLWSQIRRIKPPAVKNSKNGSAFEIDNFRVDWQLLGEHNAGNAALAVAAAEHIGVKTADAVAALLEFQGVARRLEMKYQKNEIYLYDDFAHHPSAIETTLSGLRQKIGKEKLIAILELRSNTMRAGVWKNHLADAVKNADTAWILKPENVAWDIKEIGRQNPKILLFDQVAEMVEKAAKIPAGHLVVMSNGHFENIHERIIKMFETREN